MFSWLGSNSHAVEALVSLVTVIVGCVTIVLAPLTWAATRAQAKAAWKQVHADRVAEIFKTLRRFEWFVVHSGKVGPGKDFSEFGDVSLKGGKICEEYLDLQEAFYLSRLISEPLFEFMQERMREADGLQRIEDPETFQKKLGEFHASWDVYRLAEKLRDLA